MKHDVNKYLEDIKQAIDIIEERVKGMNYNEFSGNLTIKDSVERRFLIIGEAMNYIRKINPDINISESKAIIGMRNCLVHGYDAILDSIVWDTIIESLPVLRREVRALLNANRSGEKPS